MIMVLKPRIHGIYTYNKSHILMIENLKVAGVSLGEFILIDSRYSPALMNSRIVRHEYGHTIQSRMLGPLYLLAVGIPSALRGVLISRYGRAWGGPGYEDGYPESWANKLGKVDQTDE